MDPARLKYPAKWRTRLVTLLVAIPAIGCASARAQPPPDPAPPPGAPKNLSPPSESTTPPPSPEARDPNKPLSKELKENEGVLEAPKALDNGIVREAPVPDPGTTPVIPPPGSPGGDPSVKPK
jgi:hypothetical protein